MPDIIFSTAYLPPVIYFAAAAKATDIYIEAHENYSRQTYRNRCKIAGPNGLQILSIPVIHPEKNQRKITDIRIDNTSRWQVLHQRSMDTAYNNSPYYFFFREYFEPFFRSRPKFLIDFNTELFRICCDIIGIKKPIKFTGEFVKNYREAVDLRYTLHPKKELPQISFPRYPQVFEPVHGFIENLSIIDLIFNRGPDSLAYLHGINISELFP